MTRLQPVDRAFPDLESCRDAGRRLAAFKGLENLPACLYFDCHPWPPAWGKPYDDRLPQKAPAALIATLAAATSSAAKELEVADAKVSGTHEDHKPGNAFDGDISDKSRWIGTADDQGVIWIELHFKEKKRLGGIHLHTGYQAGSAIEDFHLEYANDKGEWARIPSAAISGNTSTSVRIPFDATVEVSTDRLRLAVTKTKDDLARIKEIVVWPYSESGIPQLARVATQSPLIYLNQSGFNLNKPKRFTAPTLPDETPFQIVNTRTGKPEFEGRITNKIGDFSSFNPDSSDEFTVQAGGHESFPFRIGHWWLERVTYDNAVRFMVESRHYFGNHKGQCRGSFGWRDDHHFNWILTTLVPQYLSNPAAYDRMPKRIRYEKKEGFNGALEPFDENAPDIVKLIHHGADVIVTQQLKHELLKEQLAFFLYAWPWMKDYLPEQNYQAVADYAFGCWEENTKDRGYPYDTSKGHNLLALKTAVGSTKGENPPGHSVQPNLLMYEVAKRDGRDDAERFFQAAYDQVAWIISDLDWEDPLTTKGQRLSEHVTMCGLAMMLDQYPERAPEGLEDKIEAWKKVMIRRSDNMWDFRKLSATQWTPTGSRPTHWNEPGNVMGFPAIALAAINAVPHSELNDRLLLLAYAHLDNTFGRNPTGRHFSYDAPREIEGCDLGWYSFYRGGIGQLADTHFVFDGAPKNEHYPYNPEAGNVGWTEGWVQFNTAFNISLAYMADNDIELNADPASGTVRLKAPLNFEYHTAETGYVRLLRNGKWEQSVVVEEGDNSEWLSTVVDLQGVSAVAYGYGYFAHVVAIED